MPVDPVPPSAKTSEVLGLTTRHPLTPFFKPRSVAVIGATEKAGSVGRTILWNLISTPFGGTVFPVNPSRPGILGIKAYPKLADVPDTVDLAVIVTPAASVPALIDDCVGAGVKCAVVISAGFKEAGPAGAALERQVLEKARRGGMRIIGPNCLGVMSPLSGLNATFASAMAQPGSVAFISQSGALCTGVLDWSLQQHVGFSAFVSVGSMVDVGWGDLIDYLGDDPRTKSIVIYMESVGDARAFLSAAREVALTKPIIVIKAGRTQAAAQAAASHTGALAGSDEVLDAAFRRCGVLRVDSIAELFYMAEVLGKQPRPKGPRLTVLTNAGGPGVLATDALIQTGGELTVLAPETIEAFNALLPPHWSHGNPVDILGDADPGRYAKAVEIAVKDPTSDGLLVVLTPQAMTDPTQTAEALKPYAKGSGKPVLASWMGGADVAAGETILARADIPTFPYPDTAARVFTYMWRFSDNLRALYETPLATSRTAQEPGRERAAAIVDAVKAAGRTLLTEVESKALIASYGIPIVDTRMAATEDDAVREAKAIGYPVVVKLLSETITHKTDVGGVQLNLPDEAAVRVAFQQIRHTVAGRMDASHFQGVTVQPMITSDGYELIVGSSVDPQFGPVLLVGSGGQLVEVYRDRALGLPPLNTTLARRMLEQTQIFKALAGVRGRAPVKIEVLAQVLVQFSELVAEQRRIREIDINPLLVTPTRIVALDARVVLHDPAVADADLPTLAIRPYPQHYSGRWTMKDGETVTIRPIRPEDEPLVVKFHHTLSSRSVYFRYFHLTNLDQRIAHDRLTRICFIDYDREMALVVERTDAATGEPEILAVGRLTKQHTQSRGEYALLVSDAWQGRGIGTELLTRLVRVGRDERLAGITGDILAGNRDMQHVAKKVGFRLEPTEDAQVVRAVLDLP